MPIWKPYCVTLFSSEPKSPHPLVFLLKLQAHLFLSQHAPALDAEPSPSGYVAPVLRIGLAWVGPLAPTLAPHFFTG